MAVPVSTSVSVSLRGFDDKPSEVFTITPDINWPTFCSSIESIFGIKIKEVCTYYI